MCLKHIILIHPYLFLDHWWNWKMSSSNFKIKVILDITKLINITTFYGGRGGADCPKVVPYIAKVNGNITIKLDFPPWKQGTMVQWYKYRQPAGQILSVNIYMKCDDCDVSPVSSQGNGRQISQSNLILPR